MSDTDTENRQSRLPAPFMPAECERLLTIAEIKRRTSASHTWIYEAMKAGRFPSARRMGSNSVRWLESEFVAWARSLPREITSPDVAGDAGVAENT